MRVILNLLNCLIHKKKAIDYGRTIAKNQKSELVIHRPNGTIHNKDSYCNDPHLAIDQKN